MTRKNLLAVRSILLAASLAALGIAPINAQSENPRLVHVGIRADARPFAYFDSQTKTFEGLLVDLCFEAVQKAGFQLEKHVMTVADRDILLSGRSEPLSSGAPDLDLMCDPSTVTLKRLDLMAEQAEKAGVGGVARDFSPIVFLANGSYIERKPAKADDSNPEDAAFVATSPENAAQFCVVGPGQTFDQITRFQYAGVVQTTTATDTLVYAVRKGLLVLAEGSAVCAKSYPNHVALIRDFCAGDLTYYFGDLDIMRAYHAWYLETVGLKADVACPMKEADRPVSYEPYAFIVSSRVPGFRQKFNRALYAIFHDGKTVGQMSLYFGENKTLSPFVQTLFRINNIPSGYPPQYPEVAR